MKKVLSTILAALLAAGALSACLFRHGEHAGKQSGGKHR